MRIKQAKKQIRQHRFSLATYWLHHKHACYRGFQQITKQPLQSLLTIAVLSITLILPTILLIGLTNVKNVTRSWQDDSNIAVYLIAPASAAQINTTQIALQKIGNIKNAQFISADEGLIAFVKNSGLSDIIKSLGFNPLPATFIITPNEKNPAAINILSAQLRALPNVSIVKINMEWVTRLNAVIELLQRLTYGLAILLAVGLLLIVGNTIRLAIQYYHTEIEVIKLVGGTDSFIRRPFLYSGIIYGLAAGLFTALILDFLLLWLQTPINQFASTFNTPFILQGLGFEQTALLLLSSTLLGYVGSWLVVGQRLRQIQPGR
jgi:cell division transport system permease protein